MKKIISGFLCMSVLLCLVDANAGGLASNQNLVTTCKYTDYMYIQGPPGTHIISISTEGKNGGNPPGVIQVNNKFFKIVGDCATGYDGYVMAKIGIDESNYAELRIEDGQYLSSPIPSSIKSVGDYYFTGMEHPVFTYQYTLNFSREL